MARGGGGRAPDRAFGKGGGPAAAAWAPRGGGCGGGGAGVRRWPVAGGRGRRTALAQVTEPRLPRTASGGACRGHGERAPARPPSLRVRRPAAAARAVELLHH